MRKFALFVLFAGILSADNFLARNEAIIIDGRTNEIKFALQITKDGKIKKRFLSENEKIAIYKKMPNLANSAQNAESADSAENELDSAENSMRDSVKNAVDSADSARNELDSAKIKQWDKSKIIYEQRVYKIDILR
ncbi:hypothetical protein ACWIUD_11540 [Helicobacter sp. 23-1044]